MRVAVGDDFLLYTAWGCFHNPTRDCGRVIGRARVESSITRFDVPVTIGGRNFMLGYAIRLEHSRAEVPESDESGTRAPLRALSAESARNGRRDADNRNGD